MNNFDKVLSMVRNEDEAISAWNKIPASKKGYNPSVNKIISLICEQITSETIRKYDEKYLTPVHSVFSALRTPEAITPSYNDCPRFPL